MDTDEFLDDFCKRLLKLKTNHFVSKTQSSFFKNLKENSLAGEFLICFDFAENYAFVVQNSAQSFHWNNEQATIVTAVIYYKYGGEVKHRSIAIISDNLAHDTVAVHEYQNIIINYLKNNFEPKKIYYFTDGAGQHFKNESSFANLQVHKEDFDILAEWHFHGAAHGKGVCDGIGANIKRFAASSSLQRSSKHHILISQALFQWAKSNCKETEIFISSKESYAIATEIWKE